jgi:hypothetical protein
MNLNYQFIGKNCAAWSRAVFRLEFMLATCFSWRSDGPDPHTAGPFPHMPSCETKRARLFFIQCHRILATRYNKVFR